MAFRNKMYFIICGIVAQLLFFGDIRADELQPHDNAAKQQIVTGPEQHEMRLVSLDPWVIDGELMGAVAAYVFDDVTTERPVDYWELYNNEGNLLAVSWFDKLGIQRMAIDRGIAEQEDKLEGVFVVVLDGESI
jgi:hypothetical protein